MQKPSKLIQTNQLKTNQNATSVKQTQTQYMNTQINHQPKPKTQTSQNSYGNLTQPNKIKITKNNQNKKSNKCQVE